MPRYTVNATMIVPAWLDLDADNEEQARSFAGEYRADDFEFDVATAEILFDVTPTVTAA